MHTIPMKTPTHVPNVICVAQALATSWDGLSELSEAGPSGEGVGDKGAGEGDLAGDGEGDLAGDGPFDGEGDFTGDGPFDGEGDFAGDGPFDGEGDFAGDGAFDGEGDFAGDGAFDGEGDFAGDGALDGEGDFAGDGALGGGAFVPFSMPGGTMTLLICKTEMLNGCASTDLMKEAVRPAPGEADPSLISPPDSTAVTLMNPCSLVAMPVDWKRVVRSVDLLLVSFLSFSMS